LYAEDYFIDGAHALDKTGMTYEELSDQRSDEHRKHYIKTQILREKPDIKSIFEIGAAMGHFLKAAQALNLKVSGIEISEEACLRAMQKFGIDLIQGNFEDIDISEIKDKWDCVFAGDVFEHVRDPSLVLSKIHDILTKDGIVFMKIPSTFNLFSTKIAFILYKLLNINKRLIDKPYHLYEYTTQTVVKMFSKYFSHVKVYNDIKKPWQLNIKKKTVDYMLKYILQYINYPITKFFNQYGDRMTVVAMK